MKENMTYIRTTLNGIEWKIEKGIFGCYSISRKTDKGYVFSGYTFTTFDEAVRHLDKIDERCSAPVVFATCNVPSDYYGQRNVYYGD